MFSGAGATGTSSLHDIIILLFGSLTAMAGCGVK